MFSPVRHGWWALNVTLTFIVGGASLLASAQPSPLPQDQAAVGLFTAAGLPADALALSVVSADGQVRLEHQADQPFNPASTIKVVTTRAALGLLGEDFRFKTRIWAQGRLRQGVFQGVMTLQGGGDPKLVKEDLEQMVAGLRAKGYRELRGEWRLDGGLFAEPEAPPGQFDGQPLKPYNVTPHAAMLNFKAVRLSMWRAGHQVKLQADPGLYGLALRSALQLVPGHCSANQFHLDWADSGRLVVRGKMGRSCPGAELYVSVFDHLQFAHRLFAQAWRAAGGTFSMTAKAGRVPEGSELALEWTSPRPMLELLADINKLSNNPMARTVFLGLSAQTGGAGTREDASLKVSQWLLKRGLHFPEMVLDNGSGLSRHERISARNMTRLLLDGIQGLGAVRWVETLPAAGLEGTLRRRLKDERVRGKAWVKTGTLDEVRAYAGYVQAKSGRMIAFSAFVNHPQARLARVPLDQLVEWMIENL